MELIKQKKSMAAEISKVDPEYARYSGGSWEISSKIALADTVKEQKILPAALEPFIDLYTAYLTKQRKAFFASVGCDVITKLGFIQGDPRKVRSATERINTS